MNRKVFLLSLFLLVVLIPVTAQKKYKAYLVSNAHLDTQWNWDVQTTINDYVKHTLYQNFSLFKMYPDYVFNFEGGIIYNWMKEYYPLEYNILKGYIAGGRWHIAGSSWDANDTNVPSPESFFRNILLGQEFYKREFGVKSTDIFLPDCFGFSYTLPTVASNCGLIGFSTQKLEWRHRNMHGNSKVPFNIGLWQGVDGSTIMASLNSKNYTATWDGSDLSLNKDLINTAKNGIANTAYRYYGTGDRGGSPTVNSVVSVEKGIKGAGDIEIISAKSDQLYFDYYPFGKHPELPSYRGELLMDIHGTGCYTSRAIMKLFNRRNEQLGTAAERVSVMSDYIGGDYPKGIITEAWRRFIWHQFHDDLTGTSIPKAYTFSINDELISQTQFKDVINSGVGSIALCMNTNVKGNAVIVYNSMAAQRNELTDAYIKISQKPNGVQVYSANGQEVPAQIINYERGKVHIAFSASVAPLSCSVYNISFGKKTNASSALMATNNTLENRIYKLTLDHNGDISSLIDKRTNQELVEQGKSFRLAVITGNESKEWPAWEILKQTIDTPSKSISDNVEISVDQQGPCYASLKVKRNYGQSHFVQYIRMTDGANDDRIDIINDIDWATKNALLKAEFPMNVSNKEAVYDLGLGSIKRGNNTDTAYEVPAQQWADITDPNGSYGVSVLNNCKYGWDKPSDNTLRLTLIHSPKVGSRYVYQAEQDFGHHEFIYSIVGHQNTALQSDVPHLAESLNTNLAVYSTPKHNGSLGKEYSFVKINTPQVALRLLKKAEDGDMYIMRFYEMQGKEADNIHAVFPASIENAYEVNGIEEKIGEADYSGKNLIFNMKANSPRTFAVKLQKGASALSPINNNMLTLNYNQNAFTYDNFGYLGSFDKQGNSFASELMNDTIVNDNVLFKIGSRDEKNVIKCNGDTISLPKDAGGKKLYILATSTEDGHNATFTVNGKRYDFDIPYYSGFYGDRENGNTTIRNASLAYVGSHRHTKDGNEAYIFTYLYKFCIELPPKAKTLILPKDENVAVFAITLSDNYSDNITSINEMRALSSK
jgi:alpha-mannosidase